MQFLAERLKRARKAKGFSQQKLAEVADVALRSIASWESGDNEPQGQNLRKLCEVLQVNLEYFFGDLAAPGDPSSYAKETAQSGLAQRILEYIQRVIAACKGNPDRLAWTYIELTKRFPIPSSTAAVAGEELLDVAAERAVDGDQSSGRSHGVDAPTSQTVKQERGGGRRTKAKRVPLKPAPKSP